MRLSIAIIMILFTACKPFTKVYTEEEPGVNLYKYSTYNWLNTPGMGKGNNGPEWLTKSSENAICNTVEGQLRRFGFSQCQEAPDLILHYHIVIKNEILYTINWSCDEETLRRQGHCNRIKPVNYIEGTLILDFIDAQTGNQVWRGAVSGAVENLPPDQLDARIQAAVLEMFKKFPQKPIPGIVTTSPKTSQIRFLLPDNPPVLHFYDSVGFFGKFQVVGHY